MDEGTGNLALSPLQAKNNSAAESELIVGVIVWVSESFDQTALMNSVVNRVKSVALGTVRHIAKIPNEWIYLLCPDKDIPILSPESGVQLI